MAEMALVLKRYFDKGTPAGEAGMRKSRTPPRAAFNILC
jgi:hypothetical protein